MGPRWRLETARLRRSQRPGSDVELVVEALTRELPVVVVGVGIEPLTEDTFLRDDVAALAECESWYVDRLADLDVEAVVGHLLQVTADDSAPAGPADPAEPRLDENVQFTVYRPRSVRPGQWYALLAFAHLAERRPDASPDEPDPLEQVREQAARMLDDQVSAYDDTRSDSRSGVPQDGEITFLPEMDGVRFNPERRVFRWQEDVHREEFRIRADPSIDGPHRGGDGCVSSSESSSSPRSTSPSGSTTP